MVYKLKAGDALQHLLPSVCFHSAPGTSSGSRGAEYTGGPCFQLHDVRCMYTSSNTEQEGKDAACRRENRPDAPARASHTDGRADAAILRKMRSIGKINLCKPTVRCLPVLFVQVFSCAVHGGNDFIEGNLAGGKQKPGQVH